MIVKMCFINKQEDKTSYERIVECDTIHKTSCAERLELSLYANGKLIERPIFRDSTNIYIMENGKTVEHIHFSKEE